ncbi:hypothetical protein [Streptomyces radicis]|uniref:Uncharacterized protein n=1 Tax=Streptomyces radicis TaxID=1750517 RepID=A0A3A9WTC6_9ACTN|nr:hypothetical protein [Streptomyces radicis]RKN12784.1 hypothetical protein D7319_02285 [Streptomyces radicis]RKN27452.1 hypothetical protein D7318_00610 [Streptomyces radicis]
MSDAVQPTAAQVRAAADALKEAIDRHLAVIERRSSASGGDDEDDDAVFAAFNEMAAAGEAYDELLYDVYDEVTPFEVPETDGVTPYSGPDEPVALSLFIRRDYSLVEPRRLVAQAQRVAELDPEATDGEEPEDDDAAGRGMQTALGVLFGEFDPDEIASRHKEFGLEEGDATLWVVAAEPAEPGEWLAAPFDAVDPERVLCRFDISEAFEEDDLDTVD